MCSARDVPNARHVVVPDVQYELATLLTAAPTTVRPCPAQRRVQQHWPSAQVSALAAHLRVRCKRGCLTGLAH